MMSKCAEKTCVGLWGQFIVSMSSHRLYEGPKCIKDIVCALSILYIGIKHNVSMY